MSKHFYEIFDQKGKFVMELVALDVKPMPSPEGRMLYEIETSTEVPPMLTLPPGFVIRRMT